MFVAVLLALTAATGCSRGDTPGTTTESAAGAAAEASDTASADSVAPDAAATQALLRQLADRDETTLEFARMAVTRKEQLRVSDDARRLLAERRKESNRLLATLRGEYREAYKPRIAETDQQIVDSMNGVGTGEFDHAFLDLVSKYEEEDASVIAKALPSVAPQLRDMLNEIRAQRLSDVAAFRKQLTEPPASRR
jgi:uncharacterized protein (DUF305 family)